MTGAAPAQAFVEALRPALRQAAAIARALEGRVANRPKRGEDSEAKAALTIADTAAQEALLVPLLRTLPDVVLEAEEDTPTVARFSGRGNLHVVLDPIDGTLRSYLDGRGPYAVMVGLAASGRFEAALLALPREGLFFEAVRGCGASVAQGDGAARPARAAADGRTVLVSHGLPDELVAALEKQGFDARPACGGALAVAPLVPGVCGGVRLATDGRRGVSRRGRIGVLIAREAGCAVAGSGGLAFPDGLDEPAPLLCTASDRDVLRALVDATEALPADYMRV